MKLCDVCDIVYDDRYCPCCMTKEQIEVLEKKIESLNEEISNMEVS